MTAVADDETTTAAKESLSQFLARVLDQLTITSWLPALMLVAITLILSRLAASSGSIREAFETIGEMGLAGIVFLIAAVVLAAMFSQAFEFESIRFIEGYWPRHGLAGKVTAWRQHRQLHQLTKLKAELESTLEAAFDSARKGLRKMDVGAGELESLERYVLNEKQRDSTSLDDKVKARQRVRSWRTCADPKLVGRVEELEQRIKEFPESRHRVLPTRFGNVVRAVEERVHNPAEGRLENYVIHILDELPRAIATAYFEQRRRLDLYCGLTFVFATAIVPSIIVSFTFSPRFVGTGIAVPFTLLLATVISYRAAMASGRKFGYALSAIREHRGRPVPPALTRPVQADPQP